MMGRRGRRPKKLPDELTGGGGEGTGYWKLNEETLDCTLWKTRCGRGYGHVVRQKTN